MSVNYATGNVSQFYACSQNVHFFPTFVTELKASVSKKSRNEVREDDLLEFLQENWDKIDCWKKPSNMFKICKNSNEGPCPWTDEMRTFVSTRSIKTYNQAEAGVHKSVWEGLKAKALEMQADAVWKSKPLIKKGGEKRKSTSSASAPRKSAGKGRASMSVQVDTDEEDDDDAGVGGAGPVPANVPRPPPRPAAAPAAAGAAPRPAAAPAPAGAGAAPAAAPPVMVVTEALIKKLEKPCAVYAVLNKHMTAISGYLAVPLSDSAAVKSADITGSDFETFCKFTNSPSPVSSKIVNAFKSDEHDALFEGYTACMQNKNIQDFNSTPTGDRVLDPYSIPYECLHTFTTVVAIRKPNISKDMRQLMHDFNKVEKIKAHYDFMEELEEFCAKRTVDQKRERHATFMKMSVGYPQTTYFTELNKEHAWFLNAGGYNSKRLAPMTNDGFMEMFNFYVEVVPNFSAEDQKAYLDARDLIRTGGKHVLDCNVDALKAFETQYGALDELARTKKMPELFKHYEKLYNMYKASNGQPQPAVPAAPAADGDDDVVQIKTFAIEEQEEADLALFIAQEICKLPNASKDVTQDSYYEYVHDIVGTVNRWTEKRNDFSVDTLLHYYNFSDVTDVDVRALYAGVNRGTRPNKGTRFLDFLRIRIDGQIASQKEAARARSSKVGRKGKNARFENRGASPQPSSGDGPPSPEASPPPRGRASSRAPSRAGSPADNRNSSCVIVGVVEGKRARTPSTKYDPATGRAKTPNGGRK